MHRHVTVLTASLLALSACGSKPATTTAPALSKAQAAQVLARYQTVNNRANGGLDADLLASVETGAQLDMDRADYRQHRATKEKFKAFSYTAPAYYIPRQAGYPRWFAASAVSGRTRHALVFTQERAGAPWLLAADPYPFTQLGGIALDKEGYATAVPPGAIGSGLAPGKVAAMHAATLNSGAKGMATGPYTTGAHDALTKVQAALGRRDIRFSSQFAADPQHVFALRTSGGGALVWYVLRQNQRYDVPKPGLIGSGGEVAGLVNKRVRHSLDTTALVQYLAVVPAHGSPRVIGSYRKPVRAVAT
jgi:hypothetical protein